MELKWFRIKNYRSIKDTGDCYLSGDNITILAGKNESGKTAILEALEDFNQGKAIRDTAVNIHHTKIKPEISLSFEIDTETLVEISNSINVKLQSSKPVNIQFIKRYPNTYQYTLSEEAEKALGIKDNRLLKLKQKEVTDVYTRIKNTYSEFPQISSSLPEIDFDNTTTLEAQFNDFKNNAQPNLTQISDEKRRGDFSLALNEIISKIQEINNINSIMGRFINEVMQRLPNFILFSSFDDEFPSEIPLTEASNNELIKDLDIISNLDLDLITSGTAPVKKRHKERLNVRMQEAYRAFWSQDLTNLAVDWEAGNLQFFVTEGGYYYPPNMRSRGKQWHLAFYVRVSARAKEDVPNIILIDEPGIFVHAQAQKDIIGKLEDSAQDASIIFCTHSPYLINVNKLNRIRLVTKPSEEEGTLISNKIHKDADLETLTPIITAIGLDLSLGLDIAKDNNIITEGITDYFYLQAFQKLTKFKFKQEVHFIPCASADKTNLMASLMIGWGFNYCIVFDNDAKGRRTKDTLFKDFGHTTVRTVMVSENTDEEIEDLFTREDFAKRILSIEPTELPSDKKNSQIIKQKGKKYDKVLLSKSFFEAVENGRVSLSAETKQNIKKLLENINTSLFPDA